MPVPVGLMALSDFVDDGDTHLAGEYFEVEPIRAAALVYQHRAKFCRRDQAPQPATRTKRAYRRRDMVAETSVTHPDDAS